MGTSHFHSTQLQLGGSKAGGSNHLKTRSLTCLPSGGGRAGAAWGHLSTSMWSIDVSSPTQPGTFSFFFFFGGAGLGGGTGGELNNTIYYLRVLNSISLTQVISHNMLHLE